MWRGKSSLVNENTMFEPFEKEGQGLIDIKSRNKAINIMWLKSYLTFGKDRPLWAQIADALMAVRATKAEEKVDNRIKVLPFLQTWRTRLSPQKEISLDITNLFKTATEFKVRAEGLAFSRTILREMPIWYHLATDKKIRKLNHGKVAECLKSNHKTFLVGEMEELADRIKCTSHLESDECKCTDCIELENLYGCQYPNVCVTRAKEMLRPLSEKWDPRAMQLDNRPNNEDPGRNNTSHSDIMFNTKLATVDTLSDIFRVFTTGLTNNNLYFLTPCVEGQEPLRATVKCRYSLRKMSDSTQIGAGVAFSERVDINIGRKWPSTSPDRSGGNLLAIILASLQVGTRRPLKIYTRSHDDIAALTVDMQKNKDRGYLGAKNAGLLRMTVGRLRMHAAPITFEELKDFPHTKEEKEASTLARSTLNEKELMTLPPIPTELHLTRVKISKITITQAIAYKTIKLNTSTPTRARTKKMIEDVKSAVARSHSGQPDEKQIWKSI